MQVVPKSVTERYAAAKSELPEPVVSLVEHLLAEGKMVHEGVFSGQQNWAMAFEEARNAAESASILSDLEAVEMTSKSV